MSMNIWAPELHYLEGKWYIFFAADPMDGEFTEYCQLKTNWESFTLDSTVLKNKGETYLVWAQRSPSKKNNSDLYIARMPHPGQLELPAVCLSVPEYDWNARAIR